MSIRSGWNQIGFSSVSQILFAANNFIFSISLARVSDSLSDFGVLSAVYMIGMWCVGVLNAAINEPVSTGEVSGNVGLALRGTMYLALFLTPVGMLLGYRLNIEGMYSMVLCFTIAAFTMSARNFWIADSKPLLSLIVDATWTVLFISLLLVSEIFYTGGVKAVIYCWGLASLGSIFIIFVLERREFKNLLGIQLRLNLTYAGDQLLSFGAFRISLLLLGLIAGADALGQVRLVMVILSPMNTLISVIRFSLIPVLSKRINSENSRKISVSVVSVIFLASAVYILLAKFVFLGERPLLRLDLVPATEIFGMVALSRLMFAVSVGFLILLRINGTIGTGRISSISTFIILTFCALGSYIYGIEGYSVALVAASVISLCLWGVKYLKT